MPGSVEFPYCFATHGTNVGTENGVSIFNISNSYRTVSNHIATYHVLKIASRRATDKIVGSPGAFSVADLVVGV